MGRGQGTATMLLVFDLHEATCEDEQCLCHDVNMSVKQCRIANSTVSLQAEMTWRRTAFIVCRGSSAGRATD